jgi:hypothetical protein
VGLWASGAAAEPTWPVGPCGCPGPLLTAPLYVSPVLASPMGDLEKENSSILRRSGAGYSGGGGKLPQHSRAALWVAEERSGPDKAPGGVVKVFHPPGPRAVRKLRGRKDPALPVVPGG